MTNFKAATQGRQIRPRPGGDGAPTPYGSGPRLNLLAGGLAGGLAGPCYNPKSLSGNDLRKVVTVLLPNSRATRGGEVPLHPGLADTVGHSRLTRGSPGPSRKGGRRAWSVCRSRSPT